MLRFRYHAFDATGTRCQGSVEAADAPAAQAILAAKAMQVVTLTEEGLAYTGAAEALSAGEAGQLALHIVELTKAGVPLGSGLIALGQELPRGRLARTFDRIGTQLEWGLPAAAAIEASTRNLPTHIRGLLAAGMQSGRLSEMLEGFLVQQRSSRDLSRKVRLVVSYPLLLTVVLIAWATFIFEYVVPQMSLLYDDFGTELPPVTEMVVALSKIHFPLLVLGAIAGLLVGLLLVRLIAGKALLSRLLNAVPLFGPMRRYRHLSDYCGLLALLLEQNIPLPAALEYSAGGSSDASLARASHQVAMRVEDGDSLSQAIARLAVFPLTLQPLVKWGEENSLLAAGLRAGALYFRRRMELQSALLMRVLPPLLFVLILLTAMFVVVATYSPLLQLITDLSG